MFALLFALNLVYARFGLKADLERYSPMVLRFDSIASATEALYMGESSNWTTAPADTDMRSISQMVADRLPELGLIDFTEPATHASYYLRLLERVPPEAKLKTVVVTLNLRSFGADWVHSRLEPQLERQMFLAEIKPSLFARLRLGFGSTVLDSPERRERIRNRWWDRESLPADMPYPSTRLWDRALNERGWLDSDRNRQQDSTQLGCHYVKSYGFAIDTASHPRVRDFDSIARLAKRRQWRLVLLILPENIRQAEALAGLELARLMRRNRDLLMARYESMGVEVVDQLDALPASSFIDKDWTTEHYNQEGRRTIADALVLRLNSIP